MDFEIPAGQTTITADIGPGDVQGYEVLATVTNQQPEHRNDTYLETTVTAHVDTEYVVYDCRQHDVPTWIAVADGDLVGDGGGAADSYGFRPCEDGPFSLALDTDVPESTFRLGMEQKTARIFAFAAPSAEFRQCINGDAPDECGLPEPMASTDAEFGFRIYAHAPAPYVLKLWDESVGEPNQFEALSSLQGVPWLVDRAVVAGDDADRLVFDLPESDTDYLVDVYTAFPHRERCIMRNLDELPPIEGAHFEFEAAVHELCGADVRLVVDGVEVRRDADPTARGHYMELGAQLSPGDAHRIEVEVVRGDPRNIRYAVVVRTRTEMP